MYIRNCDRKNGSLNESYNTNNDINIYRNTDWQWLYSFLKDKYIESNSYHFHLMRNQVVKIILVILELYLIIMNYKNKEL